ncbi:MAG TPA: peptidoglycan-binding protein [Gammaproteobacteria bacterium]|nr:peptidoglycan-binding protein [Gammaproteobacteria bacterium]
MLTATQKDTAQAIVNLFETGTVLGEYGQVTVLDGDTGHLTFGRSQTTLGSGGLAKLLERYCANTRARFGARLAPYLPRLQDKDSALDTDTRLHNLLRASADDSVMRDTQDAFFDDVYWKPAQQASGRLGISDPLGVAVVYDSFVHGSWTAMRNRTLQKTGTVDDVGQRPWVASYVATRRAWLAGHPRRDLRATVYRMDAFRRMIDRDLWGLELPLVVRGREISMAALSGTPDGCYVGPQPGSRSLSLRAPMLRGLDVRLVQLALSGQGLDIAADGIYGRDTVRGVKAYQAAHGLPRTGVAEPVLIVELAAQGAW